MPQTAQQIVTLACQIAKGPGFISQGGQFLNATLQDLCQDYDLEVALGINNFSFNSATGQGAGPYTLPVDYLRTRVQDGKDEFFYTINGQPYPLIQCTLTEFDWMVQTPGFTNFPYYYATDLTTSPPTMKVWPPANGSYPCVQRYFRLMPDIVTPETSNVVPWFGNSEILLTSVAGRLMAITGDDRYEAYMSEDIERFPTSWKAKMNAYLKNLEDREGAVHTVGRDRRRWGRTWDMLRNTKQIGWALAATLACWLCLLPPAQAQQTKTAMIAEINTNWPDNTTGLITPALLRSTVTDIVNSYIDANGGTSLSCAAHTWVSAIPTLSSITCTQPAAADLSNGTTGSGAVVLTTSPTLAGTITNSGTITGGSYAAIANLNIRDLSAAFDVLISPNSASAALTAGRTLTIDVGNVPHTLQFGTTANTITFPSVASDTVAFLAATQTLTNKTLNCANNTCTVRIANDVSGLGAGVATALANAANASGGFPTDGAWTSFTASPSCGSATITTNSARSRLYAKTIHLEIDFTITAIGTCTQTLTFTLPSVNANSGGGISGREFGVSGKGFVCDVRSASSTSTCSLADFTALQVNAHMVASGVFEIQ